MNDHERFFFDLNGYLVVEDALTPDEVARCNEAIDRNPDRLTAEESISGEYESLRGTRVRGDLYGMLSWPRPWCQPFRDLLAHASVLPHLLELLREGFRLDHVYGIVMRKGAEGLHLHGGGTKDDLTSFYQFHNGRMRAGLTVVSWALTDTRPGDGGFMCIPGSHKSNYEVPEDVLGLDRDMGVVRQVETKAGSAVIFTEALSHGTMPWTSDRERRSILYKYSPAPLSWGREHIPEGAEGIMEELTPNQRALLEPPYHGYLKRPKLTLGE